MPHPPEHNDPAKPVARRDLSFLLVTFDPDPEVEEALQEQRRVDPAD